MDSNNALGCITAFFIIIAIAFLAIIGSIMNALYEWAVGG